MEQIKDTHFIQAELPPTTTIQDSLAQTLNTLDGIANRIGRVEGPGVPDMIAARIDFPDGLWQQVSELQARADNILIRLQALFGVYA